MNTAPTTPGLDGLDGLVRQIEYQLETTIRGRGLPLHLEEAALYATLGGGKRLRPLLVVLCGEALGADRDELMPAAIAIELVHTFSLVHDDLPAMDDDDVRRGRPTLHLQAGEAMAILAGDLLLALAFETLASDDLPAERSAHLAREASAATAAMIGGQVLDTLGGFPHELEAAQRLLLVHRNKTAAILRAACRMGAICACASDEDARRIEAYGEAVGLMFQVVDDLIDVTQTPEHAGKATRKDEEQGKLTWPVVHGVEASRAEVERLRRQAVEAVAPFGERGAPLARLAERMAVRTR